MKTSIILRKAKRHLSRTSREGVCSAVWTLSSRERIPLSKLKPVTQMITQRIKPFTYASAWLAWRMTQGYQMPHSEFYTTSGANNEIHEWLRKQGAAAVQEWRHAWLDQMIAEFEAKGD
jgi:EAL domain-containing protein (putative c-di-GMP-specific phosphodiesterase class I)